MWKTILICPGRNKWAYKAKNNDGLLELYKACLVGKGNVWTSSIYFNEIFSPIVKLTTIRVLLSLVVAQYLELETR